MRLRSRTNEVRVPVFGVYFVLGLILIAFRTRHEHTVVDLIFRTDLLLWPPEIVAQVCHRPCLMMRLASQSFFSISLQIFHLRLSHCWEQILAWMYVFVCLSYVLDVFFAHALAATFSVFPSMHACCPRRRWHCGRRQDYTPRFSLGQSSLHATEWISGSSIACKFSDKVQSSHCLVSLPLLLLFFFPVLSFSPHHLWENMAKEAIFVASNCTLAMVLVLLLILLNFAFFLSFLPFFPPLQFLAVDWRNADFRCDLRVTGLHIQWGR